MSEAKTILVTGTALVSDDAIQLLESRGYSVRHVRQDNFTALELHEALDGVAGYLIGGYEEPLAEHFERATELEAAAWVGTDYKAYVPGWTRAYELGIAFINSPGTNAISVAEFTVLLALTMTRPFTQRIAAAGEPTSELNAPGHDLHGHTLGIIGLGRIGQRVARIAVSGFGMDVLYFAPRRKEQAEAELGVRFSKKADLIASSDFISLHRPAPSPSEGPELGRPELELAKPGAVVLNTAHPQLVDLDALLWAVQEKDLRAAFDGLGKGSAWDQLLGTGPERFLAIPSMAFNTADANLRASIRTATAVCDVLDGGTSDAVNNPDFRSIRASTKRP